jgi:preprotein translocase subunit Sss1
VNSQLEEKVNQKIKEVAEKSDEIFKIINSLDELRTHSDSFAYGIAIGRLYNSFYYQCRRILKRNPTDDEFSEFLNILHKRQKEILDALRFN